MASKVLREEFWEELERARALLIASPLLASLERVAVPMSRAAETLRGNPGLGPDDTDRLVREVAGVGQLLDGLGDWLATRGAILPTYNCHGEFGTGASSRASVGASVRGTLAVEG